MGGEWVQAFASFIFIPPIAFSADYCICCYCYWVDCYVGWVCWLLGPWVSLLIERKELSATSWSLPLHAWSRCLSLCRFMIAPHPGGLLDVFGVGVGGSWVCTKRQTRRTWVPHQDHGHYRGSFLSLLSARHTTYFMYNVAHLHKSIFLYGSYWVNHWKATVESRRIHSQSLTCNVQCFLTCVHLSTTWSVWHLASSWSSLFT